MKTVAVMGLASARLTRYAHVSRGDFLKTLARRRRHSELKNDRVADAVATSARNESACSF